MNCPQCGEETEVFFEGYCEDCCRENQWYLDQHIAEQEHWDRLDNERREELIRDATR